MSKSVQAEGEHTFAIPLPLKSSKTFMGSFSKKSQVRLAEEEPKLTFFLKNITLRKFTCFAGLISHLSHEERQFVVQGDKSTYAGRLVIVRSDRSSDARRQIVIQGKESQLKSVMLVLLPEHYGDFFLILLNQTKFASGKSM